MHYIYFLMDPRTEKFEKSGYALPHEPIYIGKGTGNRVAQRKNRNKWLTNKINKIEKNGLKILDIVIGPYNEEDALCAEKNFIEKFGRKHLNEGPLLNLHEGGRGGFAYINTLPNGMLGKHHKEKTKKLISGKKIGKMTGDKNPSKRPEVREKISQNLLGHSVSFETREKLRQANLGKKRKAIQ